MSWVQDKESFFSASPQLKNNNTVIDAYTFDSLAIRATHPQRSRRLSHTAHYPRERKAHRLRQGWGSP